MKEADAAVKDLARGLKEHAEKHAGQTFDQFEATHYTSQVVMLHSASGAHMCPVVWLKVAVFVSWRLYCAVLRLSANAVMWPCLWQVAGTNYHIKVDVGGGRFTHMKVFQPLPHTGNTPEVKSVEVGKGSQDSL